MSKLLRAISFFGAAPEHQRRHSRGSRPSREQQAELANHAQAILAATRGSHPNWVSRQDALSILIPVALRLPEEIVEMLAAPELTAGISPTYFALGREMFGNYRSLFELCLDCGHSSLASAIIGSVAGHLRGKDILKILRGSHSSEQAAERFAVALGAGIINGTILSALALHSNSWALGFAEIAGVERERRAIGRGLASPERAPIGKKARL